MRNKAKLILVHPFKSRYWHLGTKGIRKLYWLLKARGIQERFKIFDLHKALKTKNKYNKQGTWCYCENCDKELIHTNSFLNVAGSEITDIEISICKNCGYYSEWDFGAPAPILLKERNCVCKCEIARMFNGISFCADCDRPNLIQ